MNQATASATQSQLVSFIDLIKLLMPFVGAIGIGGLITWRLQFKSEEKKQRKDTAKEILAAVYVYNFDSMNEWSDFERPSATVRERQESKIRWMVAGRRYNEAEAMAHLFVNKNASESMEKIKKTVIKMADESKKDLDRGIIKDRHEMDSGKEYDKELQKLRKILDAWISD